jgi:hypothetical protein
MNDNTSFATKCKALVKKGTLMMGSSASTFQKCCTMDLQKPLSENHFHNQHIAKLNREDGYTFIYGANEGIATDDFSCSWMMPEEMPLYGMP